MKYKYNKEFQTINTQEKAYILGLFYSDGYVSEDQRFSGITLHKNDGYILQSITELFPFMYLSYDKSKPNTINLRCNRKEFCKDITDNGVLPRKSSTNKDNLSFPILDENLIPHFIRGFFDGDGSVFFSKTASKNSKYCTFTGDCKQFLEQLKTVLEKKDIYFRLTSLDTSKYKSTIRGREFVGGIIYNLTLSRRSLIEKFCNFLYPDPTLFMKRKREKMELWYEKLSKRTACRYCNNFNTRYSGTNRLHCRDCNKYMSIIGNLKIKFPVVTCKHCQSNNTVGNGKTKSRITKQFISRTYLCRDCGRNSSYSLESAPLESNL